MLYRHTAVDDVTGTPVSQLDARTATVGGDICITVQTTDPDVPAVHHWLTPVAAEELVKFLIGRPVIPMRPVLRMKCDAPCAACHP